jgi:hypothetical protein
MRTPIAKQFKTLRVFQEPPWARLYRDLAIFENENRVLSATYDGTEIALVSGREARRMLKVQRLANGEVIFALSGRMDTEQTAILEALFRNEAEGRKIVLDLKDLTLVDRDAVRFLERCESDSIKLRNIPAYIREWIERERNT